MLHNLFLGFAITLGLTTTIHAEEHPLSTIQGKEIDLKVYDHAFAGSIKAFVVWGAMDEKEFKSELIMRREGQTVRALFEKNVDGKVGGMIRRQTAQGVRETSIYFSRIDKEAPAIELTVDGQPVIVKISAESFSNNHFMNPTYTAVINGEEISYALKGEACFGYSLHLAFLILGSYVN